MSYLWHLCPLVAVAGMVYNHRKSEKEAELQRKEEELHQKTMNEYMEKLNKSWQRLEEALIDFTKQSSSTGETANSFNVAEALRRDPSSQVDEGAEYTKEV